MLIDELMMRSDGYKYGHPDMLPEGTEHVYSYLESRGGARYNRTLFNGLQPMLLQYMEGRVITSTAQIQAAEEFFAEYFHEKGVFPTAMFEHILAKHEGRLPLLIKAVPEGTLVPVSNVLMSVVNTDPAVPGLTNFMETLLSQVWYPCTVASLSYEVRKMVADYLERTATDNGILPYALHDFGYRGASSQETAAIGGCAHLINFMGTDTIAAPMHAMQWYNAPVEGLCCSVKATEHSVMTAMGEPGEFQVFKRLLENNPSDVLSIVIDSYNYQRFISDYALKLRDVILARSGRVVFRPDSGDPTSVTIDVYNRLAAVFGTTVNSKGYTELHPQVGVLWGDGIDYMGIRSILFSLANNMYSTSAMVFGMGAGLLQKVDRDVQRFAFKSSAQCRNGVWHDIFKNPLEVSKVSKKGCLALHMDETGVFHTDRVTPWSALNCEHVTNDLLEPVFLNGTVLRTQTFQDVRRRTGNWT